MLERHRYHVASPASCALPSLALSLPRTVAAAGTIGMRKSPRGGSMLVVPITNIPATDGAGGLQRNSANTYQWMELATPLANRNPSYTSRPKKPASRSIAGRSSGTVTGGANGPPGARSPLSAVFAKPSAVRTRSSSYGGVCPVAVARSQPCARIICQAERQQCPPRHHPQRSLVRAIQIALLAPCPGHLRRRPVVRPLRVITHISDGIRLPLRPSATAAEVSLPRTR